MAFQPNGQLRVPAGPTQRRDMPSDHATVVVKLTGQAPTLRVGKNVGIGLGNLVGLLVRLIGVGTPVNRHGTKRGTDWMTTLHILIGAVGARLVGSGVGLMPTGCAVITLGGETLRGGGAPRHTDAPARLPAGQGRQLPGPLVALNVLAGQRLQLLCTSRF